MKMQFEVTISTDEATADELRESIANMLRVMDMPNGDTLFVDSVDVDHKRSTTTQEG